MLGFLLSGFKRGFFVVAMPLVLLPSYSVYAKTAVPEPVVTTPIVTEPILPPGIAVASAHPLATEAGISILRKGGNAFDAAIAISAMLAVVEPNGSGMGGGGFWLLHREFDNLDVFVDGREVAPVGATGDMYLLRDGEPDPKLSRDGPLAAGIPGQAAALDHIAKAFGELALAQSLAPAIATARNGFLISQQLADAISSNVERFSGDGARIFLDNGVAPRAGWLLRQPDLANTLTALAVKGRKGFYEGAVAEKLYRGVFSNGGIWSPQDLEEYRVVERTPIIIHNGEFKITTAPPPSAGGIAIAQASNILGKLAWPPRDAVLARHQMAETLRRIYRDRAVHLGDPDFVRIPVGELLSDKYSQDLARSISSSRATPSSDLPAPDDKLRPDGNTSHFSVIDQNGNRVSATLSINLRFGSGFVPEGTGVLLNNEMDDFATKPLHPNAYGLVHTRANVISPRKRMLSSMTPTFIEGPDGIAILGTPGGSRIVTMVLQGVLGYMFGYSAEQIVSLGRYHHQYLPDMITYEPGALSDDEVAGLRRMGHAVESTDRYYGNMQVVIWDKKNNTLQAASDPRGEGSAKALLIRR